MDDRLAAFLIAASAPADGHASGTLDEANALLAAHPDLPGASIHAAAVAGNADAVRRFLSGDRTQAIAEGGPRRWDALTYLCFSRYLRLDHARGGGFVEAAAALLAAGANPNTGWWEDGHQPKPVWESAIYGAAGVAHHAGVTRVLLSHGADPNDEETPYHAPESYDNEALVALIESGRLNADSLATMLLRKCDWHDTAGGKLLLAAGADPNRMTAWGKTALHQAIIRDNALTMIELLIDKGADPYIPHLGLMSTALAARRGRRDVLEAFAQRGLDLRLDALDAVVAQCARADAAAARAALAADPGLGQALMAAGPHLLAAFAGVGNADGLAALLDLGLDVDARHPEGDGYWGLAAGATPLHVAAWRGRHDAVRLLIARGASVDAEDSQGRTPLWFAVKACTDSYWSERRAPDSIRALIDAGASTADIVVPTGYDEADGLLSGRG